MYANSDAFSKGTSAIGGYRVTIPFALRSKIHMYICKHSSNEQRAHRMGLLAKELVSFAGQNTVANALSLNISDEEKTCLGHIASLFSNN